MLLPIRHSNGAAQKDTMIMKTQPRTKPAGMNSGNCRKRVMSWKYISHENIYWMPVATCVKVQPAAWSRKPQQHQRALRASLCKCDRFAFGVGSNFLTVTVFKLEFHICTLQLKCFFCTFVCYKSARRLKRRWLSQRGPASETQQRLLCFVHVSHVRRRFSNNYLREIRFRREMKGEAERSLSLSLTNSRTTLPANNKGGC